MKPGRLSLIAGCVFLAGVAVANPPAPILPRYKAVAFDYFILFNPDSVIPAIEKEFPGRGAEFAKAWRSKQFEYCFLRSITHQPHADFYKVTEDALVYTANAMHLPLGPAAKTHLMDATLHLQPWPDAIEGLRRLRRSGVRIITIANFSARMLHANAKNAGIEDLFDELLSTEVNGSYKPEAAAYVLGMNHLHLKKNEILFAAFGGWDAYGAKTFGYPTFWVNRSNLPMEELDAKPDQTSTTLEGLLLYVLNPTK